jgi:hypothetical protein
MKKVVMLNCSMLQRGNDYYALSQHNGALGEGHENIQANITHSNPSKLRNAFVLLNAKKDPYSFEY